MGQGLPVPQPQSPMPLPGPAHLAHKDQRLPELGLADGADVTSLCALLPSGPDSVILFVGGRERETQLWTLRSTLRPVSGPWLLVPVTLARTT